MKITTLEIHNIGIVADTKIELNQPLLLFYGEIRQGKTTILNAVRWVCGGSFPSDIIRHGEKEAFVELGFDGGCIRREWYRSKSGETKAREVQFIRAGKPVPNPVSELKRMLNPFLLNQDHLRNMNELERKKYFTELFAVDTTALDNELFNSERKASDLRAEIKGFGEINLTPVEPVDVSAVQKERTSIIETHKLRLNDWETELKKINGDYENEVKLVDQTNADIEAFNAKRIAAAEKASGLVTSITELEKRLTELRDQHTALEKWLAGNPEQQRKNRPTKPDTSEIEAKLRSQPDTADLDKKIGEAAAQQVRVEQFQRDQKRAEEKKSKEQELAKLEKRQREIRAERIAKLTGISESCGISELSFDESGNFTYQGTQAGMLSTSQVMKLSSELSALYPEGFGIELLDRGESLGRSIFDYVDHAKEKNKTILATIVGERPAKAPPEVGVFVVDGGNVTLEK